MNSIRLLDINNFTDSFPFRTNLSNRSVLITGATGLIGSTLVNCLLYLNENINITIPVRCKDKALTVYGGKTENLTIVETDLLNYCSSLSENFDYIIHCASPTDGKYMVEHPVETYELAVESTRSLLQYCRNHDVKGMVYVSSLEYYGQNFDDRIINEDFLGYLDSSSPRSSYPLGKRSAEYLCSAYAYEFGVPVKIARLTQTFGAGVSTNDNRVFAQFARSVLMGKDIVLHTSGESAKPYCYTTDCASAIFYLLILGKNGEAYNVANEKTYISVREMAEFLRDQFAPSINVVIEEHPEMGYAPVTKLHLSSGKLMDLGWKPQYNLKEMFENLIESFKL